MILFLQPKFLNCDGILEAKLSKCDGTFVSLQGKGGKKMTVSEIKKDLGNKVSFGEVTTYVHFVCCQLLSILSKVLALCMVCYLQVELWSG